MYESLLPCSEPDCLWHCLAWPHTARQPRLAHPNTGHRCRRTHETGTSGSQSGRRTWRRGWCGHRWCGQWTGWVWRLPAQSRKRPGGRWAVRWSNAELLPARRRRRTSCRRTRQTQPAKKIWTGIPTWWWCQITGGMWMKRKNLQNWAKWASFQICLLSLWFLWVGTKTKACYTMKH